MNKIQSLARVSGMLWTLQNYNRFEFKVNVMKESLEQGIQTSSPTFSSWLWGPLPFVRPFFLVIKAVVTWRPFLSGNLGNHPSTLDSIKLATGLHHPNFPIQPPRLCGQEVRQLRRSGVGPQASEASKTYRANTLHQLMINCQQAITETPSPQS